METMLIERITRTVWRQKYKPFFCCTPNPKKRLAFEIFICLKHYRFFYI